MACVTCYKDWISCGEDAIAVNGNIVATTDLTWVLTSPSGAKYSGEATTDEDGHFTIDTTTLPEGLLNPYAGIFTLEIQTGDCEPLTWNDSAYCDSYSCIEFEVKNGNQIKNTLGCDCELL